MKTLIIMKVTQAVNLHTNLLITIMGNQNPGQAQDKVSKKDEIYFTLKVIMDLLNFFKHRHQIPPLNRLTTMTIHLILKVTTIKIMNQIMIQGVKDARQSRKENFYTASVLNVLQTQ